ncbi:MAG: hypothetical protein A3J10_04040 [Candidatus Sungbacteria bacterium RIFCSPLOWO2_02_FULL_54_10]|uniref:SpoVT-AbrB domain-containing protein n=2 Tax=Candidatus Sungiibacteriota TaxID=1817917 RepID=A0A1G2L7C5_9BACT|nr:MAG: hypothetical protein A2679_02615 [Candidatus Sungbacteria bacterium RIFCSPHIGHO2_01_FULL_54_26]OHA02907.1 MAG: hypothetical protein A3C92_01590 [Candidatus Sungbacteria bacterium RIFCSPHIGHO2_02_FULL_53_17]OHA07545.1 MAG: hypothetical protein A3B34_01180 [Candidatus Sungbacteria bacterium RIFCSPLOWO2_01_FULL_54_21]OHA13044.1 MAG: hypothetical protein A3J10_04040 [Candidatus Sungbacteria bacterium RIFCSPLOWO2_02_FULL_54_10]
MDTLTIPKKLTKHGDLVVIPRREYEEFSHWKKAAKVRTDEQWFWMPEWQRKEREADEDIRAGRIIGPFSDHKKFLAALKSKKK